MTPPSVGRITVEAVLKDPDQLLMQLRMINQEAKRVERSAKILKQQSAQLIESIAVKSTAEEAHDSRDTDT